MHDLSVVLTIARLAPTSVYSIKLAMHSQKPTSPIYKGNGIL